MPKQLVKLNLIMSDENNETPNENNIINLNNIKSMPSIINRQLLKKTSTILSTLPKYIQRKPSKKDSLQSNNSNQINGGEENITLMKNKSLLDMIKEENKITNLNNKEYSLRRFTTIRDGKIKI